MTSVEVEYCEPCGFIDRATETQTQILESCGETVDGVELVPGEDGIFEVRVDDVVVFDVDEIEYDLTTIMVGVCGQLSDCDCDPSELVGETSDSSDCSPGCC
ncbi:SelT/SelW/SelH family protein [Natrinema longum]|uniref:SelT/SelW/SelH family protein n=1 Tax=Natrinema longum TaxID=370324 RepID=UPI001CCDB022|nr:Rdx family protein [Natrinema longum]MBZ6496984.1 Rdx family protein [Natrinema longum]